MSTQNKRIYHEISRAKIQMIELDEKKLTRTNYTLVNMLSWNK